MGVRCLMRGRRPGRLRMVSAMKNRALVAERRSAPAAFLLGFHADGSPAVYDPSLDRNLVIAGRRKPGANKPWAGLVNALSPEWDVFVADIFGGYDGDGVPPSAAGSAHTFEDIASLLERVQALVFERAVQPQKALGEAGAPRILLVVDDIRHILGVSPGRPKFEREAHARSLAAFGAIAVHARAAGASIIACSREPAAEILPREFFGASTIAMPAWASDGLPLATP